jgi:hypothetical protein
MPINDIKDFGYLALPPSAQSQPTPAQSGHETRVDGSYALSADVTHLRDTLRRNKDELVKVRTLCEHRRAEEQRDAEAEHRWMQELKRTLHRTHVPREQRLFPGPSIALVQTPEHESNLDPAK